jgi:membrane-anchored glycerophosphoryl diester phosphodiesterase (GDPDase)
MKFNGSLAWQEGMNAISANRSVLAPVAGVFFLLPALASVWFMSDVQMALMDSLQDPEKAKRLVEGIGAGTWLTGIVSTLLQMAGFMALLSLFRDDGRPTVGQAIGSAFTGLPTLIAAMILSFFGFFFATTLVFSLVAILGAAAAPVGFVLALMAMAVMVYIPVKLSLTMPVIVIEKVGNPLAALTRSWRLTKGNSLRLFGFYLLLLIGYVVISAVVISVLGVLLGIGQFTSDSLVPGSAALIAMGLASGLVGAAVSVLFSAILASIHRQLAGPSTGAIAQTFL